MEFAMGLKLLWNREKSPVCVRLQQGCGGQASQYPGKKSLISVEIILRPALSTFMCTAHWDATRWKHPLTHFAPFVLFTPAAVPPRFSLRLRLRRSRKLSGCCGRFAIVDQRSG